MVLQQFIKILKNQKKINENYMQMKYKYATFKNVHIFPNASF